MPSPITERMVSDYCRKRIAPHLLPVHTEAVRKFLIAAVNSGVGVPRHAGKYDGQAIAMLTNVPQDNCHVDTRLGRDVASSAAQQMYGVPDRSGRLRVQLSRNNVEQ